MLALLRLNLWTFSFAAYIVCAQFDKVRVFEVDGTRRRAVREQLMLEDAAGKEKLVIIIHEPLIFVEFNWNLFHIINVQSDFSLVSNGQWLCTQL